jgi:hypothetical protein
MDKDIRENKLEDVLKHLSAGLNGLTIEELSELKIRIHSLFEIRIEQRKLLNAEEELIGYRKKE